MVPKKNPQPKKREYKLNVENYYGRAQTLMYDYHPGRKLQWNRQGNQEFRMYESMVERNAQKDKKEYNI